MKMSSPLIRSILCILGGLFILYIRALWQDRVPKFMFSYWFYMLVVLVILGSALVYLFTFSMMTSKGGRQYAGYAVVEALFWLAVAILIAESGKLFFTLPGHYAYYCLVACVLLSISKL